MGVHKKSLKIGLRFFLKLKGSRKILQQKNKNCFLKKGPELGLKLGNMNREIAFNH
jgi:hypothetical protein